MDSLNAFTGVVRRCVDDYGMIASGDRIAVGISGGKDSLVLLASLAYLRRYYPAPFELEGITIDTGFPGMDFSGVEKMCEELGVPYTRVPTDIREIVFDARQEENPCSLCSKMRRGALNNAALEWGCNKVVLGHHLDDAVETFLLSLIYEGRISCFAPVTFLDRSGLYAVRPLLYCREFEIASFAKRAELPVVKNPCPADRDSKRNRVRELGVVLKAERADLYEKVFGAMKRLPLGGWEIKREGDRNE